MRPSISASLLARGVFAIDATGVPERERRGDGEVIIGPPKTRRSKRSVTIGTDSIGVLRDDLAAQREQRIATGAGWDDHGLVFPGVDGRPPNPASVSTLFATLVAKTGLPAVTLHALRHAHGSLCLEQGMPIHAVAARLGHSPSVLLNIYARARDGSQDAAANLESLLDGVQPAPLRVVPGTDDEPGDSEGEALVDGGER